MITNWTFPEETTTRKVAVDWLSKKVFLVECSSNKEKMEEDMSENKTEYSEEPEAEAEAWVEQDPVITESSPEKKDKDPEKEEKEEGAQQLLWPEEDCL